MSTLKDTLEYIIKNYPSTPKNRHNTPFKGNEVVKKLRNGLKNTKIDINKSLTTEGSAGQGTWAQVPWIRVYNKDTSNKSAQYGVYIVYLFSFENDKLYLSLNQGWTQYKYTKEGKSISIKVAKMNAHLVSDYLRKQLTSITKNMTEEPLVFLNIKNSNLAEGYVNTNIISIQYSLNKLPGNNTLVTDLYSMENTILELNRKLKITTNEDFQNILQQIISNSTNHKYIEPNIIQKNSLVRRKNNNNYSDRDHKPTHRDYEKEQHKKTELGLKGENYIVNYEKEKLKKAKREDLVSQVKHVSVSKGDGLGYDIESRDEHGNEMLIEVKTTSLPENTYFYISPNELKVSKKCKDKYYLYRLTNFTDDNQPNLMIIKGDMKEQLNLEPIINYIANIK